MKKYKSPINAGINLLVHKGNINQNDSEIPSHFCYIGNLQENNQVLVRTPG
jgi:hypothetical protein